MRINKLWAVFLAVVLVFSCVAVYAGGGETQGEIDAFLAAVNSESNVSELLELMQENSGLVNFPVSWNTLTPELKSSVTYSLLGKSYANLAQLQQAIEQAVNKVIVQGSESPSGGGNVGGGGGGNVSGGYTVTPVTIQTQAEWETFKAETLETDENEGFGVELQCDITGGLEVPDTLPNLVIYGNNKTISGDVAVNGQLEVENLTFTGKVTINENALFAVLNNSNVTFSDDVTICENACFYNYGGTITINKSLANSGTIWNGSGIIAVEGEGSIDNSDGVIENYGKIPGELDGDVNNHISIVIGEQTASVPVGTGGNAVFPITAYNVADGTYDAEVFYLPDDDDEPSDEDEDTSGENEDLPDENEELSEEENNNSDGGGVIDGGSGTTGGSGGSGASGGGGGGSSHSSSIVYSGGGSIAEAVPYGLPQGVTLSGEGKIEIEDETGTLTLAVDGTVARGDYYSNLNIVIGEETEDGGNSYSASFKLTVGDTAKPTVETVVPANNAVDINAADNIIINFSEPMDRTKGEITLKIAGSEAAPVKLAVTAGTWTNGDKTFTVPYGALAYNSIYEVEISLFADVAGNVIETVPSKFTTAAAKTYEVTFNANGGSIGVQGSSIKVTVTEPNVYISPLPTATKSGSDFERWYISNTAIEFTSSTKITSNIIVLASWKTRNSSGGGGSSSSGGGNTYVPQPTPPPAPVYKEKPFVNGYEDGTFQPSKSITRAEAATLLYNLFGNGENGDAGALTGAFSDAAGHWAVPALAWAYGKSYINGYEDGTVSPGGDITRAELSVILCRVGRANSLFGEPKTESVNYSDTGGHWASDDINLLSTQGVVNGYEDGGFLPQNPITRAEAVTMIARLTGRSTECSAAKTFSDLGPGHWAYNTVMNAVNGLE